jgi:ribonuclease HIII
VEKKFNYLVGSIRNKSEILFSQTVRLIHYAIRNTTENTLHINIDKQGARNSYTRHLLRYFSNADISVLEESDKCSGYEMKWSGKIAKIRFIEKGELAELPIAWASIVSKYQRELFMKQFNSFWTAHLPGIHPTAGYWQDGQRFVSEIAPVLSRLNVSRDDLVRKL